MSQVSLKIDGKAVTAQKGMTVLEAAQGAGIHIHTICHHEKLEPFGGCRLCIVEVEEKGWTKLVVSCVYPVQNDIAVLTRSPKVDRIRRVIIELLMAHAPDAFQLQELAQEYGADRDRFEKEASFCIHCGLCVRYCAEVKKAHAVGFVDRGIRKEISFIPSIAAKECWSCKECFPLCPTYWLQAVYVLTMAMVDQTPSNQAGN